MNRSKQQSKERSQRSRPSSRAGESSTNPTATAPRSGSQGSNTRNQSPAGEPSTRSRNLTQEGPSQPRASSAGSGDDDNDVDIQRELRKLDTIAREYHIVLPQFGDQLEQHDQMWSVSQQYSAFEKAKEQVVRKSLELATRPQLKLANGPGGSPPGESERQEFDAASDAREAEQLALHKRLEELIAVQEAVVKRVVELQMGVFAKLDISDAGTSDNLEVPPRKR